MTQRLLPFDDRETRSERLARILSGPAGKHCQTAARYFTAANAAEAECTAKASAAGLRRPSTTYDDRPM